MLNARLVESLDAFHRLRHHEDGSRLALVFALVRWNPNPRRGPLRQHKGRIVGNALLPGCGHQRAPLPAGQGQLPLSVAVGTTSGPLKYRRTRPELPPPSNHRCAVKVLKGWSC